jgi:RimJ/RimL family protein N-acetyltransferase
MAWETTRDVERYAGRAGRFLRSRPVEHTVPLTVIEALRARGGDPGALLGWWTDAAGAVTGAFLWTPPHPPLLTAMPQGAAAALAALIADGGEAPAAINAPEGVADEFAAAWSARTSATVAAARRPMRLHRLAALAPPHPMPPGRPVVATAADRPLLVDWYAAFGRDVGDSAAGVAAHVDDRLTYGGLVLWERDGEPVSLAGVTRQVAGVTRVAPVYTPPAHRGRGYAAAVTAAVTRAALDDGAEDVVLYTDLANPVTNRLYARLGYVPVEDRVVLRFAG